MALTEIGRGELTDSVDSVYKSTCPVDLYHNFGRHEVLVVKFQAFLSLTLMLGKDVGVGRNFQWVGHQLSVSKLARC